MSVRLHVTALSLKCSVTSLSEITFKKEATAWAWEFFTKVMEIPQERLWISVYEEDDEARDIWVNEVGVDPTHIVKLGKEDNFWEHGTGLAVLVRKYIFDRGEEIRMR